MIQVGNSGEELAMGQRKEILRLKKQVGLLSGKLEGKDKMGAKGSKCSKKTKRWEVSRFEGEP